MSWIAAIGSAAQTAGDLFSSYKSAKVARENLAKQLAWERERATNAHQWEMQDLRKAGLNPILTATGGSGASTSSITPQMPDFSGYSRAGRAISNMLDIQNQANALDIQKATEKQIKAETDKTKADTKVSESQEQLNRFEALLKQAQTTTSAKEALRLEQLIEQIRIDNAKRRPWNYGYLMSDIFGKGWIGNAATLGGLGIDSTVNTLSYLYNNLPKIINAFPTKGRYTP